MKNLPSLDLPEVAFFGRSFAEYLLFFGLDSNALHTRRLLDCAAGPSSFTAEAVARGLDVTAVDPRYNRTESALRREADSALPRMFAQMRAKPGLFTLRSFASIEAAETDRRHAIEAFLSDYYTGVAVGRYVAGALPALPFGDDAFDLVLCAHLLFTYEAQFDFEFHAAAAMELCRVARDEVRLHPLVNPAGEESALVAPLREHLAAVGIRSEVVDVDYAFSRGATRTLILHPPPGRTASGNRSSPPSGDD